MLCLLATAAHVLLISATRCRRFWLHTRATIAVQGCLRLAAATALYALSAASYVPPGLSSYALSASISASYIALAALLSPRVRFALSRWSCDVIQILAVSVMLFWVRSFSASFYAQEPPPSLPLYIARPATFTFPLFGAAYLARLSMGGPRLAGQVWCAACILTPVAAVAAMLWRPAATIEADLHTRIPEGPHDSASLLKAAMAFLLGLIHNAQPYSTSP